MSEKTLKENILNFKTFSELQKETLQKAEKLSQEFFDKQINSLIEMFIEGSSEEVLLEKAKLIFDNDEIFTQATEKLKILLALKEVEELRRHHSEELQAQEEWRNEKTQLLLSAKRLSNGNFYWDFNDLNESWQFKENLLELKAQGRLVGGGRDGFYTDQPSPGLIRFTVVKFAD